MKLKVGIYVDSIAARFLCFFVLSCVSVFGAGHEYEQCIELRKGWNAVVMQVCPDGIYPSIVFGETVVDVVAHLRVEEKLQQFVTDPTVDMMRKAGWKVWYAPNRPDSFLSTLGMISANETYLLHATEDAVLNLRGEVKWAKRSWKPNSYNLVGFSLDKQSPPTFDEFFSGSLAHAEQLIYRMHNGTWQKVLKPASTFMRNGEAFWIYCADASDYDGPVSVEITGEGGVCVVDDTECELTLKNTVAFPVAVNLVHDGDANFVPLSVKVRVINPENTGFSDEQAPLGGANWNQSLPSMPAGGAICLPLQLRSSECEYGVERKSLLRVKTDLGTEFLVPVTGLREK